MPYRVVIADDDNGMRLVLKKAIERNPDFKVIAEAAEGMTAISLFEALKPEIVFLDVEMPEINGLECAKKIIDMNPKTIIIFATAHTQYMPEAFEVYAFDYLIKPFKIERIDKTLNRIKEISSNSASTPFVITANSDKGLEKLIIKNRDGISFIDMKDIILIQREDHSTVIYTESEHFTSSESLGEIENRLNKSLFLRCHKSYIINLTRISKITPYGRWTYLVKLKDTDKDALITSDRYDELQKIFS